MARQSASFRGLLCRHLSGVGGGAWRPALAVPEPVVDRDAGLWTGWCQRAAIANGYPTRFKDAGLWTGWCQRAAISNGYPTRRKDAVIAATSWNGWCQRAATANGYPIRRKDGLCCHLLDRVVSARCYCKWLLRSLSSHSGRRGALHRQVVYEPNVQEETLTAEAADSPDFTLYS